MAIRDVVNEEEVIENAGEELEEVKDVAVVEKTTALDVAHEKSQPSAMATTDSILSDAELSQLNMSGFGSIPICVLDNGEFECDIEDVNLNPAFDCRILSYRLKYFISAKRVIDNDPGNVETEFLYTYDKATTTNDESVDELLEQWKAGGFGKPNTSEYMEVTVDLEGSNAGKGLMLLSVSPKSVGRFSVYIRATLAGSMRLHYANVITRVSSGKKITKAKYPFVPWKFAIAPK